MRSRGLSGICASRREGTQSTHGRGPRSGVCCVDYPRLRASHSEARTVCLCGRRLAGSMLSRSADTATCACHTAERLQDSPDRYAGENRSGPHVRLRPNRHHIPGICAPSPLGWDVLSVRHSTTRMLRWRERELGPIYEALTGWHPSLGQLWRPFGPDPHHWALKRKPRPIFFGGVHCSIR